MRLVLVDLEDLQELFALCERGRAVDLPRGVLGLEAAEVLHRRARRRDPDEPDARRGSLEEVPELRELVEVLLGSAVSVEGGGERGRRRWAADMR